MCVCVCVCVSVCNFLKLIANCICLAHFFAWKNPEKIIIILFHFNVKKVKSFVCWCSIMDAKVRCIYYRRVERKIWYKFSWRGGWVDLTPLKRCGSYFRLQLADFIHTGLLIFSSVYFCCGYSIYGGFESLKIILWNWLYTIKPYDTWFEFTLMHRKNLIVLDFYNLIICHIENINNIIISLFFCK